MDELAAIRSLIAVKRAASFSAAASELDYTQPAVSKQIAALEQHVGAPLVDRGVRPLRLTAAGDVLAARGEAALGQLRSARAQIDALMRAETGELRVGTFSSAAATFVPEAVNQFTKTNPGVALSLFEGGPETLLARLRAAELDLAVVYDYEGQAELDAADLDVVHVLDDPDDVVLARDHRLARRRRVKIADLAVDRWIFPTLDHDHPVARLISAACTEARFEPDIAFRINDCQGAQALVAAGLGVALLPRLAIHPVHAGVVTRPLSGTVPTRRILVARLKASRGLPVRDLFVDVLREAAGGFA